jgi:hypothetical protein
MVGHTMMELANFYDTVHGHYYTLATCLSQIMPKGLYFLLRFLYTFNRPMLANLKSRIVVVPYCTYAEISIR